MAEQMTPLPDLAAKLRILTGNPGPGYRKCYLLALDGVLPTVQRNGRRYVADADLPAVAAVLGLTIPADLIAA
jgi:hypothetical protein